MATAEENQPCLECLAVVFSAASLVCDYADLQQNVRPIWDSVVLIKKAVLNFGTFDDGSNSAVYWSTPVSVDEQFWSLVWAPLLIMTVLVFGGGACCVFCMTGGDN